MGEGTRGEMERALFLSRLANPLPGGFQRLYFGAEFCPWAFPAPATVRAALLAARGAGWAFTLATPILAESSLPRLRTLLAEIAPLLRPGDEVLISDLGVLDLIRETAPDLPVALGRVLSGQKRGPQILDLEPSSGAMRYFRQGSWYGKEAVALLVELGICRVELDNLFQGIEPLPTLLKGSLHLPYAMVASSRNCPWRPAGETTCGAPCGEVFTLVTPASPVPLYQGGNTQFLRNEAPPAGVEQLGIDRLVIHPQIPR